ncbi:MAG: hypothetical protein FWG63_00850, partial [Defluviitaleaceae bacterium]|nr:hypothetical protein [Defluviitaleaceae bacterium]
MKKIKKAITLVSIAVLPVLLLSACGNSVSDTENYYLHASVAPGVLIENADSIIFSEASSVLRAISGAIVTAQIDNRLYTFTTDDTTNNIDFINKTESVVWYLHELGFPTLLTSQIQIHSTTENLFTASSGTSVHFDNPNNIGWLAYLISNQRLPIWLCVGIEAVARKEAGLLYISQDGFLTTDEPFGDLVFTPVKWNSLEQEQAINNAYHFVRFLINNGHLVELIDAYIEQGRNLDEANRLAEYLFYGFSGEAMDTTFLLSLAYSNRYSLNTTTDFGDMRFAFDNFYQNIPLDRIREIADLKEYATLFAANIHDPCGVLDMSYIILHATINYGADAADGFATGTTITVNRIGELLSFGRFYYVLAHEISHVLSRQLEMPLHIELDEGLASIVGSLFVTHMQSIREGQFVPHLSCCPTPPYLLEDILGDIFNEEDIVADIWQTIQGEQDFIRLQNLVIYWYFNLNDYQQNLGSITQPVHPHRVGVSLSPYISTFGLAGAFVHYLLNTYGAEAYVQFASSTFEEAYGITIHEMIDRWKLHISDEVEQQRR